MEELKPLFEDGSLTYEQFEERLAGNEETILLANLRSGKYVDKDKFDKQAETLAEYETQLTTLKDIDEQYTSLKAEYETVNAKYDELLKKQEMAEKMDIIRDANVDNKFAEFVYAKVSASQSEGQDFQTALSEFLKDNSQYLNTDKGTFVELQNGNTGTKTASQKFNEWIRRKK